MGIRAALSTPRRWVALGVILLVWCFFYWAPLLGDRAFNFRDSATFYRPLYLWLAGTASTGQVPLWNEQVGLGVPVVADATSGVFYPGKFLFWLPVSSSWSFNAYIALHSLLAAAGVYLLSRCWRRSRLAGGLAALSYAFGGSVLFQHCNVVYLVGAAWLPWSVFCLVQALRGRPGWWGFWSATLAMMVLGGDPQMAYHSVLLAGLAMACRLPKRAGTTGTASAIGTSWRTLAKWAVATGFAACLAAVQIAPSRSWTQTSSRAAYQSARSAYELWRPLGDEPRPAGSASPLELFRAPSEEHAQQIYAFSVGPWRWAEWILPNVSGKLFPEHRRWIRAFPSEGRTWAPSLYMGLPAVVFACLGVGWRDRRRRWLLAITLFALAASLGWYGLGWLVLEFRYWITGNADAAGMLGEPVGGLYWILVTMLPGYAYFRYPAKWLTIATLGIALLAAFGWDRCRLTPHGSRRLRHWLTAWGAALLAAGLIVSASSSPISRWMEAEVRPEPFFGEFSSEGAIRDLQWTFAHAAGVVLAMSWLLRGFAGGKRHREALLCLAAVELAAANAWLIPTSPTTYWKATSLPATAMTEFSGTNAANITPDRIYRSSPSGWLPKQWMDTRHEAPLGEALQWNANTLYPNLHLLRDDRVALLNGTTSITSARWNAWWTLGREWARRESPQAHDLHPHVLLPLGVNQLWLPATERVPLWPEGSLRKIKTDVDNLSVWNVVDPWPRAWIVRRAEVLPPIPRRDAEAIRQRTREVLRVASGWRDLRSEVVLEAPHADQPSFQPPAKDPRPDRDRIDIIRNSGERLILQVDASKPCLLVVSNQYAPGWQCRATSGSSSWDAPVLRANSIMQAITLPAGEFRVDFAYRPRTVVWGSAISVTAWLLLLGGAVHTRATRRRPSRGRATARR